MKVKVAAILATTSFLLSVQDPAILKSFQALREAILAATTAALQSDESLGRLALESLAELSKTHPHFWQECCPQLVKMVSEVIKAKSFEDGTRSQAAEIVLTLSKEVPATLRKVGEVKSEFVPAIVQLVTECEEDADTWAEAVDDECGAGNDAYSAGTSAVERLSSQMKEKFTLEAFETLIGQCLAQEDWKVR